MTNINYYFDQLNTSINNSDSASDVAKSFSGYIAGMIVGSILIAFAIGYFVFFIIKGRVYRQLLKRVGVIAEQTINDDISLWSRHTHNKFFKTPLFRYGNDKIFNVDSILLTDKALIVIEIKSIKGGVRGSAKDFQWTKVVENNQFPLPNIILQNDEKITQIRNILGLKVPMISLIVFSNKATFIDLTDLPSYVVVTKHTDIFNTLDQINLSLTSVINKDLKRKIVRKLKNYITNRSKDKIVFEEFGVKEMNV